LIVKGVFYKTINNYLFMEMMPDDTISIEILIHAPVQEAWKAWTDPEVILKWFGSDPNGCGLKARLDVRLGGTYEISFRNSDFAEHTCSGVYTEIKAFSKLAFSWVWKSEPGVESLVTVEFLPEGDHTRLRFEHARVGHESQHDYLYGWQGAFLKLERTLNAIN
jgi:uncharacterized protein YndB with AHSA1/START domain